MANSSGRASRACRSDPSDPDLLGGVPLASFGALPHIIHVNSGPAAGDYEASGAAFGTPPTLAGLTGNIVAVNDGVAGARPARSPTGA